MIRLAGRVPASAMVVLAAALIGDAVASIVVSGDATLRSLMRRGSYGDPYSGTSSHERSMYWIAGVLLVFAACYLALGWLGLTGRSGPLVTAAAIALTGVLALWSLLGETAPWSRLGRWTDSPAGPGQYDWSTISPAVPGWYPGTSHVLAAVEVCAMVGAMLVLGGHRPAGRL
ncbi:hypothetical protein [Longispora fulva]|uniref:Uncharacterized protein n=1 Tax=Longispora fulva TaxID=619741 RepID=A0A8J7KNX3_9ACTN|nr:hypothetical protein [Longispora fulva]MBG6135672.1 hypothetical protein [Longispora fulva]